MASILDRIVQATAQETKKKAQNPLSPSNLPGVGGLISGANIAAQALKKQPIGGPLPMPTSFSAVNAVTGAGRPQATASTASSRITPQQPTAQRKQTATPVAGATAQPTTATTQPTPMTFGADSSRAFREQYGRNPTGSELNQFIAGTYRPPTPAPEMLRDAAKADTGEVTELSLAKKLLSQQYGDMFSDAELDLLARRQLEQGKTDLTATEKALADLEARFAGQSEAALQRMRDEEARLAQRREEQLRQYENALRAQADADIAEAQRVGRETQTTEERLLGARGNLTSAVGANRLQDIQRQTSSAINAVNARVQAQLAMEKARLEGADEATMQGLADRYNAALDAENAAQLESERILQEAKLQAQQAGDAAFLSLVQNAIDQSSLQKVASKADAALTKNIGDGFIYDEFGQRITDAEGNFVTYERPEEVDQFMNVGGNLFNRTTGEFIMPPAGMVEGQVGGVPQDATQLVEQVKSVGAVLDAANFLANNPDLDKYVGTIQSRTPIVSKDRQDFVNKFNQVVSNQTLDNLGLMKGVLTDRDIQILREAATSLSLRGSEQEFKRQIQEYRDTLARQASDTLSRASGRSQQEIFEALTSGEASVQEIVDTLNLSFNQPAGTGSTTLRDGMRAQTPMGNATLTGVERGSKKWQYGLDMVLSGGKGAPVPFPFTGTVISAQKDGGFGNSVQVQLPNGLVMRTSHLDAMNVKPGQTVRAGQIIGTQGNTGDVYSLSGGDGTHLDITIYDQNGNPYSSQQVAQILGIRPLA